MLPGKARLGTLGVTLLVIACLAPQRAAADQFVLRDGRKISGTLVGYENGMFRVQTEFGFALIRKDKVATVIIESGEKENSARSPAPSRKSAEDGNAATVPPGEKPSATATPSRGTPAASGGLAGVPSPPSRPLNEPPPAHIRERLEGNDYVNETFHFTMYKPPDWKLYEELHREQVSAIVALSSEDDRTLLFVDRQVWTGAPNLGDDRVEARLRSTCQDYKKLSQSSLQVDGLPALRTAFTGVLDGVEWYGISVRIARDNTVFGIVGLTSAETYRFQEAVFNKIVKSFRFIPSASPTSMAVEKTP